MIVDARSRAGSRGTSTTRSCGRRSSRPGGTASRPTRPRRVDELLAELGARRAGPSAASSRWSSARRSRRSRSADATSLSRPMFTGLVREVGRVVSFEDGRLRVESSLAAAIGDSVAIDGVCLTVVDGDRQHARVRRRPRDARADDARPARAAASTVNLEPALRAGEPLGGHYVQGHVDGVGPRPLGRARGRRPPRLVRRAARGAPLLRREGLGRGRRRLADRRRARRRRLRGRARPAHARGDDARRARGRATRSTSRPTCSPSTSSGSRGLRSEHGDDALSRASSRRSRRRSRTSATASSSSSSTTRPRERGRSVDRRPVRDARGDQLHGHARARPDLPLPDRGALRRARPAADDRAQRGAARHRVHRRRSRRARA